MKKLLEQPNHGGANVNDLLVTALNSNCAACVPELVKAGAKPDGADAGSAATSGHEKLTRNLIEAGVEPDAAIAAIREYTKKNFLDVGYDPAEAQAGIELVKRIAKEREMKNAAAKEAPAAPKEEAAPAPTETKPWWSK